MLPPPPRRIHPTHSKPALRLVGRILVACSLAVTLLFAGALAAELILRSLAHEVTATVWSIHESPDGKSYSHRARYSYTLPGQTLRNDESRISYDAFRRLREPFLSAGRISPDMAFPPAAPGKLAVKVIAFGPLVFSRAVDHEWATTFFVITSIFTPVSMLLSWALYLAIIIRPRRYRRLFSHGIEVPGTIVDKHEDPATDGYYYAIKFSYTPLGEDQPRIAEAALPGPAELRSTSIGQQITALYDPKDPRRAVAYELGGFKVE